MFSAFFGNLDGDMTWGRCEAMQKGAVSHKCSTYNLSGTVNSKLPFADNLYGYLLARFPFESQLHLSASATRGNNTGTLRGLKIMRPGSPESALTLRSIEESI
jgi:hypothetical protein